MSMWRRIVSGGRQDPVRQVLCQLLKTDDFSYDVLGILGLERRYEVSQPGAEDKIYLNVLAYGTDCGQQVAELTERRRSGDDSAPRVLAWKDCEPLLNGCPYILADAVI